MVRIFVKPRVADGIVLRVEDELGRVIPASGMMVNKTTHISRAIKAKDLEVADNVPKPAPTKPEKKKEG